jgi:hypothetical protein
MDARAEFNAPVYPAVQLQGNQNDALPIYPEGVPHIREINELAPIDDFQKLRQRYQKYLEELKPAQDESHPILDLSYFENELATFFNNDTPNKKAILRDCLFALHRLVKLKHAAEEWKPATEGTPGEIMYKAGTKAWQQGTLLLANLMQNLLPEASDYHQIQIGLFKKRHKYRLGLLARTFENAARVTKSNPEKLNQHSEALIVARDNLRREIELPRDPRLNTASRIAQGFFGAIEALMGATLLFFSSLFVVLAHPLALGILGMVGAIALGALLYFDGCDSIAKAIVPYTSSPIYTEASERINLASKKTGEALDEIIQVRKADSPFRFFGSWNITKQEKLARNKKQDDFNVVVLKSALNMG